MPKKCEKNEACVRHALFSLFGFFVFRPRIIVDSIGPYGSSSRPTSSTEDAKQISSWRIQDECATTYIIHCKQTSRRVLCHMNFKALQFLLAFSLNIGTVVHGLSCRRDSNWSDRRAFLGTAVSSSVAAILAGSPISTEALQERNEALCGTGFFTNIALYKCTDIGDISDEGRPRSLSSYEQGSMQSLMDKMGVDASSLVDENDEKEESSSKQEEKSGRKSSAKKQVLP